jgi:hypothetical protein
MGDRCGCCRSLLQNAGVQALVVGRKRYNRLTASAYNVVNPALAITRAKATVGRTIMHVRQRKLSY